MVFDAPTLMPMSDDFDWVTARAECSLVAMFAKLQLLAKRSVATRNGLPKLPGTEFVLVEDRREFRVIRTRGQEDAHVDFELVEPYIRVTSSDSAAPLCEVSLTLTDAGQCRFVVRASGRELEPWQVLCRALEHLFFLEP